MVIFIILFFCLSLQNSLAQETTPVSLFNQYQSDYVYQYNLYQQAYSKYTEKSQIYAKYKTITTQKDKISTAISAINARNLTLKSYFMALRVLLDQSKSANPDTTQAIQDKLSLLENWITDQSAIILTLDDLDKLQQYATSFQKKYIEIQQIVYTALVQNEVNLRQLTLNELQSLTDIIKNNPQIKPESQQWIATLSTESDSVSFSLTNALNLTKKEQFTTNFINFYPSSQDQLNNAQNRLIKITSDLKLIVNRFYQP